VLYINGTKRKEMRREKKKKKRERRGKLKERNIDRSIEER
jgi:hypothetical protein